MRVINDVIDCVPMQKEDGTWYYGLPPQPTRLERWRRSMGVALVYAVLMTVVAALWYAMISAISFIGYVWRLGWLVVQTIMEEIF